MECRNLVTLNNFWSPHTFYVMWELSMSLMVSHTWYGIWEPCNGVPHMYDMIWMGKPSNCQWLLWSPLPYTECGNLVTVNDLWSTHTWYGILDPVRDSPTCTMWFECGNLVTVNGLPLSHMECGNLAIGSHHMYDKIWMGKLLSASDLWSHHTLYGMWEPCNCQWLMVTPYLIWNVGTL